MQDPLFIELLKEGDKDAFRELVETYQIRVVNLAYGFLHDVQEAEDIAQDVFIEVYESIHKFRGDSAIQTWIYRITVNKSLNQKKRKSIIRFLPLNKSSEYDGGIYPEKAEADSTTSPEYPINQQEDRAALHRALDKLPAKQKTAFLLSKYEALTYKEIAGIMKTTVSSVESLLFRAKSNLQKYLATYMER